MARRSAGARCAARRSGSTAVWPDIYEGVCALVEADGGAELAQEGAVLEGRAFASRAMRWMPPMLRDRYRLVISERMNAPAEVGIRHATESQRQTTAASRRTVRFI